MNDFKKAIAKLAEKHKLQIIYSFGSRAQEINNRVLGKKHRIKAPNSDLDIGIKPKRALNVKEIVEIAIFFEDLFDIPKVDVISIPDVSIFLALEIVQGELLYVQDEMFEAEYQLYIMRRAAELTPFEYQARAIILDG